MTAAVLRMTVDELISRSCFISGVRAPARLGACPLLKLGGVLEGIAGTIELHGRLVFQRVRLSFRQPSFSYMGQGLN